MPTASDVADWWEENRQYAAGYTDRALSQYVQDNPGLFAVVVAGSAQTIVEFPMAIGAGFVDVLNLGRGAADGGLGYLQDGLRFRSVVAPLARGGQAVLGRVLAAGALDNCTWIAATRALPVTGSRPFALVRDLAKATGLKTSGTGGAFVDELLPLMKKLGARFRVLTTAGNMDEVVKAASSNRKGVVMFSVEWVHAAFNPQNVGHTLFAAWDAGLQAVRFTDRSGRVISSLTKLRDLYPGIQNATPYGAMAFIENAILTQTTITGIGVASSIYDVLALELDVVFAPAPEIIARAKAIATMEPGELTMKHVVTVGPGDSLSKLAQSCFDAMLLWPVIYDANKATIDPNANLVRAGQQLTIPDISALTPAQLAAYRRRGKHRR